MSTKRIRIEYQFRRGSSALWADKNPVLKAGEPGYDITRNRFKIGDGETPWNDLNYTARDVYEIAVDLGYEGTVEEWLASLKGPPGSASWGDVTDKPTTFKPDVTDPDLSATYVSGLVQPPEGFSLNGLDMPTIHRLGAGRFLARVDVSSLRPAAGVTYYVKPDAVGGEDGLTRATATRLSDAILKPDVGTIVLLPGEYYRTVTTAAGLTKSINYLAAAPGVRVTGWNNPGSTAWTLHSGSVYKTTRSATTGVYDLTNRTEWGDYTRYEKKADVASITGPGQWTSVGSDVYVWCIGNTDLSVGANRYQIRLAVTAQTGVNIADGVSYLRGIDFEGFSGTSGLVVAGNGLAIAEDCTFRYGQATNGVNVNSGRGAILVRCEASSNELDGFNYHGTGAVEPDFIEIDCTSHHNGLANPGTNNATTAHEQVKGIRVGGDYDVSGGPVVADVNEAKTWNLGCRAGTSTVAGDGGSSWRCDSTGFPGNPAEMWLDECSSDGSAVAVRPTGAGATINLHAFRSRNKAGTYPTDDGVITYYDA